MNTQLVTNKLAELDGIGIGGRNINIRYADDMVVNVEWNRSSKVG